MADTEFIVTHGRARAPLTVRGKTLKEALENEGLDPAIWKPIASQEPTQDPESGTPENSGVAP